MKKRTFFHYLTILTTILAVLLGGFFLLTFKEAMASNAAAHVPETIAIFLFLGAIIDVAALLVPRFRFLHLLAVVSYCYSLMKEIYLIPNLIADEVNDIHYQGGSLPMNVFYLSGIVLIIILGIVVCFNDFLTPEGRTKAKEAKAGGKAVRITFATLITIASTAGAVLLTINLTLAQNISAQTGNWLDAFESKKVEYDFDPTSITFEFEKHPYREKSMSEIHSIVGDDLNNRKDMHKVYTFEGSTAEGWQGDYSLKKANLTLWQDGLFNANINGSREYGYWYNVDAYGEPCLNMRLNNGTDLVCIPTGGSETYYEWYVDVRASYNGGRLIKVSGLKYYPIIGLHIMLTGSNQIPWGKEFDYSTLKAYQVRNNMSYGSIFDASESVKYSSINTKQIGKQTLTATWGEYTDSLEFEVLKDTASYTFDITGHSGSKTLRFVDIFDPNGIKITRKGEEGDSEFDVKELTPSYDTKNNKVVYTLPDGKPMEIPVTYKTSEADNTVTGKISGKDVTVVLLSHESAKVNMDGKTATINIELTGNRGLSSIKVLSLKEGEKTVFDALTKTIAVEEKDGRLVIPAARFYMSTTKANSYSSGSQYSQTGNTYFAITNEEFLTAFWNWTYEGDECLTLKCTYSINEAGTSITLNSCLEYSRNEWQYLSTKTFTVTSISADEIPSSLYSRLVIYQ